MSKSLFKTMVAVLAIAAAAAGPVRGQSNPTKYTSAVAMSALQVGDTLAEGFSLTGNESNFIYLVANRHKHNENLSGSLENITLGWIQSIGANCVFSALVYDEVFTTFAPVDENGQDGDAWVVTEVESIADFTNITIAGIRIPGPPHTVRFAAGNDGWSVKAVSATTHEASAAVTAPNILENVFAGDGLVATYNGTTKKVKSVKAVKYVAPAATVASAPTATGAIIEAGSTAALVNAGTAIGGTMMYAVTTTNVQPASTAGFSASVPTAEGRTAGTYYVWYYAKADADHSDSEIAGPVSVTVTSTTTTVTWNSTALSAMQMTVMSGSQSRTQDDVTVTVTSSGEPMDFGSIMGLNGTGNFVFSTELGNITQIVISFSDMGNWFEANAGWPSELYSYEAGTFTWSGTPASSVTLSGDGGNVIFGITSIVFTIQPNN